MRQPLLNLAAVGLMSLLSSGCDFQIEDTDGDGVISVEEFQAALQSAFCGDGEETQTDDETEATNDEPASDATANSP